MEPGKYNAKVVDYFMSETRAGNPQVVLKFMMEDGNTIYHYMSLSEKAQPYTAKTLAVLGYEGQDVNLLADGPKTNILNLSKTVELVLDNEEWNGKVNLKVKWVNELGGTNFKKLAKEEAAKKLIGVDLRGHLAELKAQGVGTSEDAF